MKEVSLLHMLAKFVQEVRELEAEVGPARAWELIAGYDAILDLTSGEPRRRAEGATVLGKMMTPPKVSRIRLVMLAESVKAPREEALRPSEYCDRILFPESLLMAVDRAEISQTVRLGAKWVTRPDGKKNLIRPLYDLDIGDFAAWLHQQATQAAESILRDNTYPKSDALNRAWTGDLDELNRAVLHVLLRVRRSTGTAATDRMTEDSIHPHSRPSKQDAEPRKVEFERDGYQTIVNASDADPVVAAILRKEIMDSAENQVAKLLSRSSETEYALIRKLLSDDDLELMRRGLGNTDAARRQRRARLRKKLKKTTE